MKTKTNLILLLFITALIGLAGCGDDKTNTVNNSSRGNDAVFGGLPANGITVMLNGARLYKDDVDKDTGTPSSFSIRIASTSQSIMSNGIEYVPNYVTFPTGPTGPLSFYAISRNDYVSGDNKYGWGFIFPWSRFRYALEGNGQVTEPTKGAGYYFQGDLILYMIDSAAEFVFDTGSFGLRLGWGGHTEPVRKGYIR